LRFGPPANDFIFDAMVDRLWEIAQGRFGARSMRACLESPQITVNQQRRVATAVILNSIPLATNPNGALLLTWLLDTSGFPSRYNLLAPRFAPHLSHLCTHKLASLTVLRIVNQKVEPDASLQIVEALFNSPGDHVLQDVLGDQVNGVAVVHKIITSPFLDAIERPKYIEATKRVLIELKVLATQAYRRLIEEVGLPIPAFQPQYPGNGPQQGPKKYGGPANHGVGGLPPSYPSTDQGLASMMAALQMGGQNPHSGPPQLQIDPGYSQQAARPRMSNANSAFSPSTDPFNPFAMRSPTLDSPRGGGRRPNGNGPGMPGPPGFATPLQGYGGQSPSLAQAGTMMGAMDPQQGYGALGSPYSQMPPPQAAYPAAYMHQVYQQQNPTMGAYQA
jgi:protein JSN1